MLFMEDTNDQKFEFNTKIEAQEYIEQRHAGEGGFDWVSQITDDMGNIYGCNWKVEIEKI